MHINNAQIQQVYAVHLHKVHGTREVSQTNSSKSPDELILSPKAAEMQQIKQALNDLPEIRANLVRVVSSSIQSGAYTMDGKDIADSILSSALAAGEV